MQHLIEIICKTCNEKFLPKSERNQYCSRKCFKKDYYHKKKAEELNNKKNPTFTCPNCDQHITLSFDPVKDAFKWLHYKCNGCNTLMISVSEEINTEDETIA